MMALGPRPDVPKVAEGKPLGSLARVNLCSGPAGTSRASLTPRQNLAHPLYQLRFGRGELGALSELQIVGATLGRFRKLGAEVEVADRHLRAAGRVALVRALDDGDAASAPVRIFELRVHAPRTQIEFGRDPRLAQARDEPLVSRQ